MIPRPSSRTSLSCSIENVADVSLVNETSAAQPPGVTVKLLTRNTSRDVAEPALSTQPSVAICALAAGGTDDGVDVDPPQPAASNAGTRRTERAGRLTRQCWHRRSWRGAPKRWC